MKNKTTLFLISLILIICSAIVSLDFYTKKEIDYFTDEITQWYLPFSYTISLDKSKNTYFLDGNNYSKNTNPIQLYSVLLANIHSKGLGKEKKGQGCGLYNNSWCGGWGSQNSINYQNGWRKKIMENPKLAYWFLDNYGTYLIKEIDKKLEARNSKRNTSSPKDWKIKNYNNGIFTSKKFWKSQKEIIKKYNRLIDELLSLSNNQLERFIFSIGIDEKNQRNKDAEDFELWLEKKGLVNLKTKNIRGINESPDNFSCYPGDFLQLTKRSCINNTKWTPKKFLKEANKFSTKSYKLIDEQY